MKSKIGLMFILLFALNFSQALHLIKGALKLAPKLRHAKKVWDFAKETGILDEVKQPLKKIVRKKWNFLKKNKGKIKGIFKKIF